MREHDALFIEKRTPMRSYYRPLTLWQSILEVFARLLERVEKAVKW